MPPAGRLSHVVVDCLDPERVAAFWSALLDLPIAGRWNQYVFLAPSADGAPAVVFQQVAEPKQGKARAHLDVTVEDLDVAGAHAEALGATRLQDLTEDGVTVRVMADVEGHEFCLVRSSA